MGAVVLAVTLVAAPKAAEASEGGIVSGPLVYDDVYGVVNDHYLAHTGKTSYVLDKDLKVTFKTDHILLPHFESGLVQTYDRDASFYGNNVMTLYTLEGKKIASGNYVGLVGDTKYAVTTEIDGEQAKVSTYSTDDGTLVDTATIQSTGSVFSGSYISVVRAKDSNDLILMVATDFMYKKDGDPWRMTSWYTFKDGMLEKRDECTDFTYVGANIAQWESQINGVAVKCGRDHTNYWLDFVPAVDANGNEVTIGDYTVGCCRVKDARGQGSDSDNVISRQNSDIFYARSADGKYGAVTSKGDVVIPFEYDAILDSGLESSSLVPVKKDGAWYLYDIKAGATDPTPEPKPEQPAQVPAPEVSGDTGVKAEGTLTGENIPADAKVALTSAALEQTSTSYQKLAEAVKTAGSKGQLTGVYSVDLTVGGKEVHDHFGTLELTFPVDAQYNGRTAVVWHLHNNGQVTSSDNVTVANGAVTVKVTDLSDFAIEVLPATTDEGEKKDEGKTEETETGDKNAKPAGDQPTKKPADENKPKVPAAGDPASVVPLVLAAGTVLTGAAAVVRKRR